MTMSSWAQEKGKGVSHRYLRDNHKKMVRVGWKKQPQHHSALRVESGDMQGFGAAAKRDND